MIYYITTPLPLYSYMKHEVGGEWNFFFFTKGHAGSYIYPYIGIDRLTITPEIFNSGALIWPCSIRSNKIKLSFGEMAEWLKVPVLKTGIVYYRGFESLSLLFC